MKRVIFWGLFGIMLVFPGRSFATEGLRVVTAVQAKDTDFCDYEDYETPDKPLGDIIFLPGCSWYCGGSVEQFVASSFKEPNHDITYIANNIHDFDLSTAWIEGQPDFGIGESITYTFDTRERGEHRLGITQIILANGYKKSRQLWERNSRVKTLNMSVNETPYAILQLLDSYEIQTLDIGRIMLPQNGIMTITFEIVDVFPGTTYKDVAISELVFDGVGVH